MSQPASRELAAPCDLPGILHPADTQEFLSGVYGQRFLYVPGTPGKFSALLPWPVLNRILEEHRLEPPRLRLTREGKPVPPERYLSWQKNRRKSGNPIPRVNSTALTRELREGATLVLDAVDELQRPVRRLAGSLERVFRVRVQVNAYSGWRTSHGFDLHWDDHDVFVLQVAGRKHWKVYGITRPYPLARDVEPAGEPPSEVLWEGLLEDGGLLYIPRGWWHVAVPLDEPTLHLTVGVNNLNGTDFLSWFADRMRMSQDVRRDIPHWQGPEAVRDFAARLRDAVADAWQPELIDEFLDDMDARARPRPSFSLPWSATAEVLPPGDFRVRWSGNRQTGVSDGTGDQVFVQANGRRWHFAGAARPSLEMLVSGRECSVSELRALGHHDEGTAREFLRELAANGLIVVV